MLNYEEADVDTQEEVEELLCDIQRTDSSNMLDGSGYEEIDTNNSRRNLQGPGPGPKPGPPSLLTTAGSIARSGALIFNAMAAENMDAVENEWVTLDLCLTHPTPTKNYHYHMFSPCFKRGNGYASTTEAPNMCKDTPDCVKDPMAYAMNGGFTDTSTYGEIIGVSKEGHMIYGPYNPDGELWTCDDHDICNGTFIDGNYVYLSTTTFPYVLGCFGPGTKQLYNVSCSNSSCPADVSASMNSANFLTLSAIAVSAIAAVLF